MDFGLYKKERYRDAKLINVRENVSDKMKKIVASFLKKDKATLFNEQINMYFYGNYRIGKTWLLHAMANYFIEELNIRSVYFISAPKLIHYFFNKEWNYHYNVSWLNFLAGRKILLIDDLGKDNFTNTEFIPKKMDSFLRYRFNNNLLTYVTSNHDLDELERIYNDSVKNFISGEYLVTEITGDNMSKIIKKEVIREISNKKV